MENWTIQEEADKLKARFAGVNRAEFARIYKIRGGDTYIYQHINGRRPLNLDAALAYAKGFNVQLEEISPRLASEVIKANKHLHHSEAPYYAEIEKVIELMEDTDDRGRLKCLLAVEDTLTMHTAISTKTKVSADQYQHYALDSRTTYGAASDVEQQMLESFRRATESGKKLIINATVSATKTDENNNNKENTG